jgi:hypothetical protein
MSGPEVKVTQADRSAAAKIAGWAVLGEAEKAVQVAEDEAAADSDTDAENAGGFMSEMLMLGLLLPLVMMFDLPDHLEIDDQEVQKIQVI